MNFRRLVQVNGIRRVLLVTFVRVPMILPFWALVHLGEWAERVGNCLDKIIPGLEMP